LPVEHGRFSLRSLCLALLLFWPSLFFPGSRCTHTRTPLLASRAAGDGGRAFLPLATTALPFGGGRAFAKPRAPHAAGTRPAHFLLLMLFCGAICRYIHLSLPRARAFSCMCVLLPYRLTDLTGYDGSRTVHLINAAEDDLPHRAVRDACFLLRIAAAGRFLADGRACGDVTRNTFRHHLLLPVRASTMALACVRCNADAGGTGGGRRRRAGRSARRLYLPSIVLYCYPLPTCAIPAPPAPPV